MLYLKKKDYMGLVIKLWDCKEICQRIECLKEIVITYEPDLCIHKA